MTKNKEKLVTLHGLFGSKNNWKRIAQKITNHPVELLDIPNHGDAPFIGTFNIPKMATALVETLTALHPPIHLLGHSLGGKIALQIAHDFPELIQKLIIVDIAPKTYPPHHQDILNGLKHVPLHKIQTRSDADTFLKPFIDNSSVRHFLIRSLNKIHSNFQWQFDLDLIINDYSEIASKPHLTHPIPHKTLFLRGEKSNYILETDQELLKETCPKMRCETIPETGHWIHAENPDAVIKSIQDFLEET